MTAGIYLAGIAVSIIVVSSLFLNFLWNKGEKAVGEVIASRRKRKSLADLPDVIRRALEQKERPRQARWLETWNDYASSRLAKTGWKVSSYALFNITVILGIAALTLGAIVFKNIAITTVIALSCMSLPIQLLNWAAQKYDRMLVEQMPLAIQTFVAEYESVKNIREALNRTAQSTGYPLKKTLDQCLRDLAASRVPQEAFKKLAASINNDYGKLWAQMLLAATEDQTVVKMMPQLALRLSSQKMLEYKNSAELSGERKVGILLNILILPCFFIIQFIFPDTREFFTTQPLGKIVVMLMFLSVSIGLALDQILRRVEV